ncbi:interleukin-1 receptor antagonist protein [Spea bombifrons]|uniref:interleukin-1 receptor antagonist protein n=1 Tax=Spea bombifrons TaxID=233779 RepID=UPI00234A51D4|nr:interleukin-1 receptor antagonist protein [Spea bombifrons]
MAQVPELDSYLMDSYSEHEEEFYADYSIGCKKTIEDSHWMASYGDCDECDSGITPLTLHSMYSFKKTVILVVAIEKLKKRLSSPRLLEDTDLLSLLDDIFVEEEISFENAQTAFASASDYKLLDTSKCKIKDSGKKCLVLQQFPGKAQLVAIHLQGLNIKLEQMIQMAFYATENVEEHDKRPVTLALAGKNLYLSCTPGNGAPQLNLEEVTGGISNNDLRRFLFLKSDNSSSSSNSFESAAHRGWYISTSQRGNELVQMMPENDQRFIREFTVTYQN